MKVIAFSVQKGGTGKTSTSGNVAFRIAQDRKTVLIDADPQGNTSSWLTDGTFKYELADVLQGKITPAEALVRTASGLYILPTFSIGGGLKNFAETKLFQQPFIFEDLNEELTAQGFDYCIYDLSPGMSMLERAVILSCDEVITPLTPEYFSTDGLEIFAAALAEINKSYRKNVIHKKVIANNVNKSYAQHNDRLTWFQKLDYDLFVIPQDRNIADSQAKKMSLYQYNNKSRAVEAFDSLAVAVMGA